MIINNNESYCKRIEVQSCFSYFLAKTQWEYLELEWERNFAITHSFEELKQPLLFIAISEKINMKQRIGICYFLKGFYFILVNEKKRNFFFN